MAMAVSGAVLSGLGSSFLTGGKRSATALGNGVGTGAQRVGRKTLIVVAAAAQPKKSWIPAVKGGGNFLDPEWLDGSLPGDYGFDPLGLGKDPAFLKWYREAELIHGRWAMAAVLGIFVGQAWSGVPWFEAGAQPEAIAPFSFGSLLGTQLLLMGWVESKRWVDFFNPDSQSVEWATPWSRTAAKSEQNEWSSGVWANLTAVRKQSPLVQCITNFVSMDLVANTLLSAGASPAMVHSVVEIPDFTPHIHALCVNVGTLTPDWLPSMKAAAELASKLGKPWVLDPAAVSCSGFRLKACLELIELKPTVIKGNGSEIIALSSASRGQTKGADSSHESTDAIEAAKSLALSSGAVVAVSGAVDIVTDGKQVIGVHNGTKMMQKITATGCSLAGLVAAFLAIDSSRVLQATVSAMSVFGIAGELGEAMANGPASLRMHLIDSLYGLDETTVLKRVNVTRLG